MVSDKDLQISLLTFGVKEFFCGGELSSALWNVQQAANLVPVMFSTLMCDKQNYLQTLLYIP